MAERDWHVLLVGGPSGTGKSTVCGALMRQYGVGASEIDDIETAVQAMTTPEQQPILHHWSAHAESREWTAEEIFDLTLAAAEALSPAVEAVVQSHLNHGPPVIMEGDYLLPALAGRIRSPRVRVVFLYEPDEAQLVANFLGREQDEGPQYMRARVSWLFGQWLAAEAPKHGVAAIPVRPWDTLSERLQIAVR
ncbi:hypothetical protein [Tenggerimyces flavus]|uniref:Uridine kinase n=1 Tax=Tenggerimyces flavus TaxID=1708749 RepID=A0ABV7YIB4_9ACTN|nr:hypothetical protein [Tenggerimyces flavus]MBM7784133.1 2-phosphoglycerate kinase [Tenggerimyces flavus]